MAKPKKQPAKAAADEEEVDIENVDLEALEAEEKEEEAAAAAAEGAGEEGEEDPEPEESIEVLKKRVKESDERAAAKERENDELRQKNKGAGEDVFAAKERELNAHAEAVKNTIEAKTALIEKLEEQIVELQENGDNREALKKQRELNKADAELRQAEYAKTHIETLKESLASAKENMEVSSQTMTDKDFETAGYLPAARAWIKEHKDFQVDKNGAPLNRFTRIALSAHQMAVDVEEIKEGSPEYFTFIEETLAKKGELKLAEPEEDDGEEEEEEQPPPKPKKKKTSQSTAAPGSGRSASPGADGKRKGALTAEEASHAKVCGMSHEEYWEELYGENANQ